MANGRNPSSRRDTDRVEGPFLALPHDVMDCPAYQALSHPARSLLLEIGRQLKGSNNGWLVVSRQYMIKRGWRSQDTLQRAKDELLRSGFIVETVKGQRPNKVGRYAVTWQKLARHADLDPAVVRTYVRGAYRNDGLGPSDGLKTPSIGPPDGLRSRPPGPSRGPVGGLAGHTPGPSDGHLSR